MTRTNILSILITRRSVRTYELFELKDVKCHMDLLYI